MASEDARQTAEDRYYAALDLMAEGKTEQSVAAYRESLAADPTFTEAMHGLARALQDLERYDEAAVAYDQSRRVGVLPWRITWYQHGIFEAYFNTQRYSDGTTLRRRDGWPGHKCEGAARHLAPSARRFR